MNEACRLYLLDPTTRLTLPTYYDILPKTLQKPARQALLPAITRRWAQGACGMRGGREAIPPQPSPLPSPPHTPHTPPRLRRDHSVHSSVGGSSPAAASCSAWKKRRASSMARPAMRRSFESSTWP